MRCKSAGCRRGAVGRGAGRRERDGSRGMGCGGGRVRHGVVRPSWPAPMISRWFPLAQIVSAVKNLWPSPSPPSSSRLALVPPLLPLDPARVPLAQHVRAGQDEPSDGSHGHHQVSRHARRGPSPPPFSSPLLLPLTSSGVDATGCHLHFNRRNGSSRRREGRELLLLLPPRVGRQ